MKLKDQEDPVEISGTEISSSICEIGDQGKIISFMRENLYKNPIKAFVREILCNARDANREVEKDEVQIKVFLPTHFSPTLKIQDSGPGISPERLDKVYRKFGVSSKNETNDFTGGFGLGSKSPWAYTDTFNIQTVSQDGNDANFAVRRFYAANKAGTGSIVPLNEEFGIPISECGTIIEIPIKSSDFVEVITQVYQTIDFWEKMPEIKPNTILEFKQNDFLIKKEKWGIYKSNYVSGTIVIIDGIDYELNFNDFGNNLPIDTSRYQFDDNIALFFNNGELSLSISRDSLHFDEETIKKILLALNQVYAEYAILIKEKIEKASGYWEAFNLLKEMKNALSHSSHTFPEFFWNGLKITSKLQITDFGKFANFVRFYPISNYRRKNKQKASYSRNHYNDISISENAIFYISTSEEISTDSIKYLLSLDSNINIIHLPNELHSEVYLNHLKENKLPTDTKPEYNLKYLDVLNVQNLDDVQIPEKEKKILSGTRLSSSKDKKEIVGRRLAYDGFSRPELIQNDGGYYVVIDALTKDIKIGNVSHYNAIPACFRKFLLNINIIAVTKQVKPYLSSKWTHLNQFLIEEITNDLNNLPYSMSEFLDYKWLSDNLYISQLSKLIEILFQNENFNHNDLLNFKMITDRLLEFDDYTNFAIKNTLENCNSIFISKYFDDLNVPAWQPSYVQSLFFNLKEKYPLIFNLADTHNISHSVEKNALKQYITAIDLLEKERS